VGTWSGRKVHRGQGVVVAGEFRGYVLFWIDLSDNFLKFVLRLCIQSLFCEGLIGKQTATWSNVPGNFYFVNFSLFIPQ
jgi:hypothetical protein